MQHGLMRLHFGAIPEVSSTIILPRVYEEHSVITKNAYDSWVGSFLEDQPGNYYGKVPF